MLKAVPNKNAGFIILFTSIFTFFFFGEIRNLTTLCVLPFGQMSFWGATVITNLLSPFPSLIEWVCGGHYVYNPTLKRFFLFHFQFPFLLCGFRILHLFYLHFLSSNNPLRNSTNNKIRFTSIFTFFFFGEIRNLTTLCVLPLVNNGFSLSSFFLSLLSYLQLRTTAAM
eukprot:UN0359